MNFIKDNSLHRVVITVVYVCILTILFPAITTAQSISELFVIDFESYTEGTAISNQYEQLGILFSIDSNSSALPIIAVEGSPTAGFNGPGADTPMSSGSRGLTDPIIDGDPFVGQDIAMDFNEPVTSIRMFVIDIDGTDSFTVRAYDSNGLEVNSVTHSAGQAGTGEGVSTEFFLNATNIARVVVDAPTQAGYAVDFLSFTRPCDGNECGLNIEVAQESAPSVGDFSDNVLGYILAYPISSGVSDFYAYNVPESESYNGHSLMPVADRSHLLVADTADGLTLVIVHDRAIPDDPNGGIAEMKFKLLNDPNGVFRSVEDDPSAIEAGAGYTGDAGELVFTTAHKWSPCCTDGVALSGLDGPWLMFVQFQEVDGNGNTAPIEGISEWFAYSSDGSTVPLTLQIGRRLRLRPTGVCVEGNLDYNCFVNFYDFALFAEQWFDTPCVEFSWCGGADLNQSGVVDYNDLYDFVENWLFGSP